MSPPPETACPLPRSPVPPHPASDGLFFPQSLRPQFVSSIIFFKISFLLEIVSLFKFKNFASRQMPRKRRKFLLGKELLYGTPHAQPPGGRLSVQKSLLHFFSLLL